MPVVKFDWHSIYQIRWYLSQSISAGILNGITQTNQYDIPKVFEHNHLLYHYQRLTDGSFIRLGNISVNRTVKQP